MGQPLYHVFINGRFVPRDQIKVIEYYPPKKRGVCIYEGEAVEFVTEREEVDRE